MIKVSSVSLTEISPDDYRKCRQLNFRSGGTMQEKLCQFKTGYDRRHADKCRIIMAKDGDTLIGWSFVFRYELSEPPSAHFYVRRSHRNQGVGKRLMKQVLKENSKIHVSPHDAKSSVFFRQFRKSFSNADQNGYYFRMADDYKKTGVWNGGGYG